MIALALPLFLVAGWPLKGWAAAALLWVGAQAPASPTLPWIRTIRTA